MGKKIDLIPSILVFMPIPENSSQSGWEIRQRVASNFFVRRLQSRVDRNFIIKIMLTVGNLMFPTDFLISGD